jgi:hypothetical protein
MIIYVKNTRWGAVCIECAIYLGIKPMYSFSKWKNESILEFPWVRIILTPASTLKNEKNFGNNGESNRHSAGSSSSPLNGYPQAPPED